MAIFQVFSRLQLPQPQVAPAATQHPQPAEPGVPRQLRADQLGGADGDGQAAPGVLRGQPRENFRNVEGTHLEFWEGGEFGRNGYALNMKGKFSDSHVLVYYWFVHVHRFISAKYNHIIAYRIHFF